MPIRPRIDRRSISHKSFLRTVRSRSFRLKGESKTLNRTSLAFTAVALAVAACTTPEAQAPANHLVAAKVAAAPVLDGNANDAAWAAARSVSVEVSDGANFGGKGGTYYIIDGNQVPFDDSKFKAGDEVASFLIYPLRADRADIKVAGRWANGVYTYEVARKLVTGSKFDVQFSDLAAQYGFGFAAFDNAQVHLPPAEGCTRHRTSRASHALMRPGNAFAQFGGPLTSVN